jgi:hypothetical protein
MYDSDFLTLTQVKRRGWTDTAIKTFLAEPDEYRLNPKYASAALMRLYLLSRVEQAESTPEFKDWMERSAARRAGAKKAVRTKAALTDAMIDRAIDGIQVPVIPTRELVEKAIHSWQSIRLLRGLDAIASLRSSPDFLERISLNYIRHELTRAYDRACSDLHGRVGGDFAYDGLRMGVDDAIHDAYPTLGMEIREMQSFTAEAELQS